jgi:hypothetical protein
LRRTWNVWIRNCKFAKKTSKFILHELDDLYQGYLQLHSKAFCPDEHKTYVVAAMMGHIVFNSHV